MPTNTNLQPFKRENISGGVQRKTSKFQQRASEVNLAINATFTRIGGVEKVSGMSKLGHSLTETTTSTSTSTSSTTSSSTSTSSTTTMA